MKETHPLHLTASSRSQPDYFKTVVVLEKSKDRARQTKWSCWRQDVVNVVMKSFRARWLDHWEKKQVNTKSQHTMLWHSHRHVVYNMTREQFIIHNQVWTLFHTRVFHSLVFFGTSLSPYLSTSLQHCLSLPVYQSISTHFCLSIPLYLYLHIYLAITQSIYLALSYCTLSIISLSFYPSFTQFIHLSQSLSPNQLLYIAIFTSSICPFFQLHIHIHLPIAPSVRPSVHPYTSIHQHVSISLPISLSISLYPVRSLSPPTVMVYK